MKTLNLITFITMTFSLFFNKNDNSDNESLNNKTKITKKYNKSFKNKITKYNLEIKNEIIVEKKIITKQDFLYHLGERESCGDYKIANKYLYVGKYQFGKYALREVGYDEYKISKIRNSIYYNEDEKCWRFDNTLFSELEQEVAINILMSRLEQIYLKDEIDKFVGQTIGGVKITKAGILAGAHLGGAQSVKRYLYSNGKYNRKDANMTSVKDYMRMFEHYHMYECFDQKEKVRL